MQFGICTAVEKAAEAKAAGWDFVEENIQGLLQGQLPDAEWKGMSRVQGQPLPVLAANCLVPGSLKITGPDASMEKLRPYITSVMKRAKMTGMKVLVFGSAGARNLPEGFSREKAKSQIMDFLRMAVLLAAENGIMLVCEPLNKGESNIINSVAEGMEYVKAINHPNFQCLVDSFHYWLDDNNAEALKAAMPWIKHVHLADVEGRVAPGESGKADYRPFFRILKQGNYQGVLSVECMNLKDLPGQSARMLPFLKKQWNEA